MLLAGARDYTVEIAASRLDCFRVITDFAAYPSWSSSVEEVAVLERDRAGIGRVIEYHVNMRFKTIRYVLEYAYRKPRELTWHLVDGDLEAIEGAYRFGMLAPKLTEATCHQAVRVGFWVPGPLRQLAERHALQQSVLEFKAEVEQRVAVRPKRPSKRST